MLKIRKLKSGYGDKEVLHGVGLEVGKAEIVAIIGPNGSGKSTLLKSIFNLCDVYSGDIVFCGKNLTRLPTHKLIQEGVSYVPQGRQVFSDLTVKENLEMGAFTLDDRKAVASRIDEVFKQFPFLAQKQDDYAFTLSGGQQQMLSLARALMQDPRLLLLDEPSLGLAPKTAKEVFDKVKEINRTGVSAIIVEQNARQAVALAHRTYVLEAGRVSLKGGKDILRKKGIRGVYFGARK